MTILSLALYGSCAREDHDKNSDIDVFALTTEASYRMIVQEKLNIACYPQSLAIERARQGDLFILHITEEGKTIYDTTAELVNLKMEFQYKESYIDEITNASDLGWLLIRFAENLSNYTLLNRRIAWCVRTILIAKSAEQKKPQFSAKDLSNFAGEADIYSLIKNKSNDGFSEDIINIFKNFLQTFGSQPVFPVNDFSLNDYFDHFTKKNNIMGLKTVTFFERDTDDESYV